MRIIHCLWDDKFMDGTIRVYENDKRHSNDYVLVKKHPEKYKLKNIKSTKAKIISPKVFLSLLDNYDVVVLHSFKSLKYSLICEIPKSCKVVWYAWGFDLYSGPYAIIPIQLYNKETLSYINDHPQNKSLISSTYSFIQNLHLKKALSRVDYFSGVFAYEYNLVKEYHKCFRAKPVDFYYGDTDFFIKDEVTYDCSIDKKDIILGNSADPCNNHHDALTAMSKTKLPKDAKIIIPLSYAGDADYVNWVKEYAESLFPGQVKPLQSFLPLDEYISLISNCRVAIFYHERQQASDNIFMQMLYGAKVYMSETSLAYKFLKKEGFIVFSLQNDIESLMKGLSKEEIIHNREILASRYPEKTILSRVVKINDLLAG